MYSLKNFDKSYTRTGFLDFISAIQIHLLALLGLLIRPNDRFPKPFHTLQLEISQRPFQYLKPFREEHRRIGRYKEYPSLPPGSLPVPGSQEGHRFFQTALMSRHSCAVACLHCCRAVMRLAGVLYLTSRSPGSFHTCCRSPRMSLMGNGWGRVFPVLNSALSERTALVILLPIVTIGFNWICPLAMCNYVFCVFLTSLVI